MGAGGVGELMGTKSENEIQLENEQRKGDGVAVYLFDILSRTERSGGMLIVIVIVIVIVIRFCAPEE